MTQMTVTFEWHESLGSRWLNKDNLANLLTTKNNVEPHILSIQSITFSDSTAKERAQDESQQLSCRMDKLGALSYKDLMALDEHARCLIQDQYNAMTLYREALQKRIELW